MDFLRRLDPGNADTAGAASLDTSPRWIDAKAAPLRSEAGHRFEPVIATTVTEAGRAPARPRERDAQAHPAAKSTSTAAPAAAAHAPAAAPHRSVPPTAFPSSADRGRADAKPQPPSAAPAVGAAPAASARPIPHASPALDPRLRSTVPRDRGGAAVRAHPSAPPFLAQRPLRIDALPERPPRTAGEPPVVHVTIDRIDVRLPPPDATPPARERRPRAAGSVAPLADYLRGGRG